MYVLLKLLKDTKNSYIVDNNMHDKSVYSYQDKQIHKQQRKLSFLECKMDRLKEEGRLKGRHP